MKRILSILILLSVTLGALAQGRFQALTPYTPGVEFKGLRARNILVPPALNALPDLPVTYNGDSTRGAICYLTTDSSYHYWTGYNWIPFGTGTGGSYTLPIASASVLGGIKVGSGLSIDVDGVLAATGGGGTQDLHTTLGYGNTSSISVKIPELYLYDSTNEYYSKTKITDGHYQVFPNASDNVSWTWDNLNFGFRWQGDNLSAGRNRLLADADGSEVLSVNGKTANSVGAITLATSDIFTFPNTVKKYLNGYGLFVALNSDSLTEGSTNLFFTNARARTALSLTTTGTGAATYNNTTGVFNIPNYTNDSTVFAWEDPLSGTQSNDTIYARFRKAWSDSLYGITALNTANYYYNSYKQFVALNTDSIGVEGATNLWFTNARARAAISLTTTGSSGAATYSSGTGVLNIPNYTLAGLGGLSNSLADGKIWVGNGSNVPTAVTPSGDATMSNAGVIAIGANKVTDAMIRQSAGLSVIGRSANSTGNVADITAGTAWHVLRRDGSNVLGFGTLNAASMNATYTNGYRLQTDGSGNLSWVASSSGLVSDSLAIRRSGAALQNMISWNAHSDGGTFVGSVGSDSSNIFIGKNAGGLSNLTGYQNIGFGLNSLTALTTGYYNTAFGHGTLSALQGGNRNTVFGQGVFPSCTSCFLNIGMGNGAGTGLSTKRNNVIFSTSVSSIGDADFRILIGPSDISSTFATQSILLDPSTSTTWSSGNNNTQVGYQVGVSGGSGTDNSNYGMQAGFRNTGSGGTNIGEGTGSTLSSGTQSGNFNTSLGFKVNQYATTSTTGTYNVAIGAFVLWPSTSASGQLNIGNVLYGTGLYQTNSNSSTPTTGGALSVGITAPAASAILDLTSTAKGLLIPRMTKTQRDAISSPATGLMIYQTDNTPGLRVYNGTNWMRFTETAD